MVGVAYACQCNKELPHGFLVSASVDYDAIERQALRLVDRDAVGQHDRKLCARMRLAALVDRLRPSVQGNDGLIVLERPIALG